MATVNTSDKTVVLDLEAMFEATAGNPPVRKVQRVLFEVGLATAYMAVHAAIFKPPSAGEVAYFIGLGGAFLAGIAEVLAAFWIAGDAPARRVKGNMIIYASVVPLAVAAGLGGFSVKLNN